MGLFLDLLGVIGRDDNDVASSLKNYTNSVNGGLEKADIDNSHKNFCVIESSSGNTTIFYPAYFTDWKGCSEFISKDLNATVFSCHIHDGDLPLDEKAIPRDGYIVGPTAKKPWWKFL